MEHRRRFYTVNWGLPAENWLALVSANEEAQELKIARQRKQKMEKEENISQMMQEPVNKDESKEDKLEQDTVVYLLPIIKRGKYNTPLPEIRIETNSKLSQ